MAHWKKQEISFFLTSNCNLECPFCYMPRLNVKSEHRVIDLEFAKAGIDHFFTENQSRTIRFFAAGEPTQAFGRMREIQEYAKRKVGGELKVELQTNGCFHNEVADWIDENVDICWISCDGPPEIQDSQRPMTGNKPSSPIVLTNIKRFSKSNRMQFGVRATIMQHNLHRQSELIKYFHSLGIRYVCAAPTYHSTVRSELKTPPLLNFAEHFVPAFYLASELGMFYQTHLIVNFDEPVQYYCRACTPCPQLTSDGYVSCCDWASFGPDYLPGPLQQLIYGHFDQNTKRIVINEKKKQKIINRNIDHISRNGCQSCDALSHCAGGCVGKMIVETHQLYKATQDWCSAVRYLLKNIPVNQERFPVQHS